MRGVDLTWAGGEHNFLLNIDLLRALQDKCDAGPAFILDRLSSGRWMVNDVTETVRLGLEGGGLAKEQARRLVSQYVEDRPLTESVILAQMVLTISLYGPQEDQPEEPEAGETTASPNSLADAGDSAAFIDGAVSYPNL